ncbi:MAG: ATP-dependent sacrificial sulfur transferase LarE [Oscillospiraceae bacterium]|nr:ATP-dependent sacrificial sulfur transferase LarE [Oscillospiraceae bacterium]
MNSVEIKLEEFLKKYPRVAIAFSGGVDSSYLLYAAKTVGCDVNAYFIKSQFQPQFELDDAISLAQFVGVPLTIGTLDSLADSNISANPADRCYYCKNAVFSTIWELARADGHVVLFDGTNADDDESDRAGMVALRELKVLSPLRECGLTKSDIRRLSKEAGLFTHDKPSYACLATRIPTGTTITNELLEKTERAEELLHNMGFSDFRIRLNLPNDAKLQIHETQWSRAAQMREEIYSALKKYYDNILLDLLPR